MADFLHRKKDSTLWYYRRRFPKAVAAATGKAVFMQSLQTSNKQAAEHASRQVSVQFDSICAAATMTSADLSLINPPPSEQADGSATAIDRILAGVPQLVRDGARRVIEEQLRDPSGWQDLIGRWKMFYQAMVDGHAMPAGVRRPAVEAQAILNGIRIAERGDVIPEIYAAHPAKQSTPSLPTVFQEEWKDLLGRALGGYAERVSAARYQLAKSKLGELQIGTTSTLEIQSALHKWCLGRLQQVKPRTVATQLDCMVSALKGVIPDFKAPPVRELKGVMQPNVKDRLSMPLPEISRVLLQIKSAPQNRKVRKTYNGGASAFDPIAFEVLAVLGLRPRELVEARPKSLIEKRDFKGRPGIYFQVERGKNKASEREIPISDGRRNAVDIDALRAMLLWQEENSRSPHGSVSSLCTRFRKLSQGYTPYQMRHTWKDVALHAGVDMELRERILGHKVRGIAGVYGSDIPLAKGLDAVLAVRDAIYCEIEDPLAIS